MPLYCWSLISGQAVAHRRHPPFPIISRRFLGQKSRTTDCRRHCYSPISPQKRHRGDNCLRNNQRGLASLPPTHDFASLPKNSVGVTHKDGESAIREISIDDARGRMIFSLSSPLQTDVWMWGYRKLPSSSLSLSFWGRSSLTCWLSSAQISSPHQKYLEGRWWMSGRHTVGRPRQTECNQACHIRHHQAVLRHCPPSISAVLGTERTGKEPEGPPPPPLLLSLSIKPQILTHLKSPSHRTHQLADIIVTVIVFIYRAVCGIFMTTSARENITLPSA